MIYIFDIGRPKHFVLYLVKRSSAVKTISSTLILYKQNISKYIMLVLFFLYNNMKITVTIA